LGGTIVTNVVMGNIVLTPGANGIIGSDACLKTPATCTLAGGVIGDPFKALSKSSWSVITCGHRKQAC
jgi:hypothetical protein